MKNKKGFTLIELLAVIAILAILLLLITPNILSMFTKGKKDSFVIQYQSVYRTAQEQAVSSQVSGGNLPPYCNDCGLASNPINNQATGARYYVEFDETTGNISQIAVSDGNFCVVKTSSPSISLESDDAAIESGKIVSCSGTGTVTCSCVSGS